MTQFPRITRNPSVMSGRACIRDTQIAAGTLLALLAVGRSHEEIIRMFPMLTPEDLRETLAFAAFWIDEQKAPSPAVFPEREEPNSPPNVEQQATGFEHSSPLQSTDWNHSEATLHQEVAEEESPSIPGEPEATTASPEQEASQPAEVGEPLEPEDHDEMESEMEGSEEDGEPEETLELFHPDYPDEATVVLTRHGIYDRRWGTHTIAWSDIREIHRKSRKKTVDIILRNPEFYITSMPFFKRLRAQFLLTFNINTMHLDTASLGIRTKDLYLAANRLWVSHRGRVRFRKKRRVRVDGTSGGRRTVEWHRYQPM